MKRTSQTKTVKASSEASKLKEMQKAYGILPPEATKSKSTKAKPTRTSGRDVSPVPSKTSTTKSRNSMGSSVPQSNRTSGDGTTGRKSYPPEKAKATSKILATSRANYAEKYAELHKKDITEGTETKSVPPTKRKPVTSSNTNSPYKQTSVAKPAQKTSSKASTLSTTSRLTTQKQPSLYESDTTASEQFEENYDEDFEEDYESDFEEEPKESSEGEAEQSFKPSQNGFKLPEHEIEDESMSVHTDDYDKSSSLKSFEQLEKMVEREDEMFFKQQTKPSMTAVQSLALASGEPAAIMSLKNDTDNGKVDEEEEGEDEEDDEMDSLPESPQIPKQNAFPLTTGFSLSASPNFRRSKEIPDENERNGLNENALKRTSSEVKGRVAGMTVKGPGHERSSDKVKRTNRGKIIQSMIKLDRVAVDIFHLAPYQYERFMAVFSGTDRLQASTQTDQDKSEESAQTDLIEQVAKWTQKPPTWSTTSSSVDIRIVRQEALGVGSDEISDDLSPDQKIYKQFDFLKNWEQLSKFILRSSRKMLYVLEAEERIKLPKSSGNKGSLETIKMNRGLSVLSKLGMHTLTADGEFVACANGQREAGPKDKTTNGNKKHTSKNLVTVWSLKEPSMPLYFLRVWGHVSALKVHMIGRIVASGNKDGSLNIWNLDEAICYHSNYQEQVIRTPSVNTSCMMPTHMLPIVGVEMFSETKNTFSIVSIDKEGVLITWSCVRSQDPLGESTLSQHSSAWSTLHITVRHQIQLAEITRDSMQVTCFFVLFDKTGEACENFCFGTLNGYAAKGRIEVESGGNGKGEATAVIEKYQERLDMNPKVTCVDVSTALNILIMGCEDGRCRLFELNRKKMVLCIGGGGSNSQGKQQEPIRVKWSGRRASVVYVALKDSLLIWDLLTSDMNPWKTIHLKDLQDFVLYSPPHKEYLVIISGNDLIISTPADEVKPLGSRDLARIHSYFSLLC